MPSGTNPLPITYVQQFITISYCYAVLTHWGRVTHICVRKSTTIGSDNGLSPRRRQAIIWTNAGILLIGPLGTNLSEILSEIQTFSLMKMHLKMSSGKWRPFCLGLNVLICTNADKALWCHIKSSEAIELSCQSFWEIWTVYQNLIKMVRWDKINFISCQFYTWTKQHLLSRNTSYFPTSKYL